MPGFLDRWLTQWAVVWPAEGRPDQYGEARRGAPIEVRCAWDRKRRQSVSAQGTPVAIEGVLEVDRRLTEGSLVYLDARLTDLAGTGLGDPPPDGTEVLVVDSIGEDRDLNGWLEGYSANLARYAGSLPGEA